MARLMPAAANAYAGRESVSTRNPHEASKPLSAKEKQALSRLSPEERVLRQWRAAYGCPISDESKAQFCISACGKTFTLADCRLWKDSHNAGQKEKAAGSIHLEFFFDGSTDEIAGQEDVWTTAFENMLESQLQEVRVTEFRKRLASARRRPGKGTNSASEDCSVEGGSDRSSTDDDDWRSYLKNMKPVPKTDLHVRSIREAGCMLRFLVCQTSISAQAAEVLGQIAFQEHFPIDGVDQEPSKSTMPLPRWIYMTLAFLFLVMVLTFMAWAQVVKQAIGVQQPAEDLLAASAASVASGAVTEGVLGSPSL